MSNGDDSPPGNGRKNPISDVQNLLGFLLTGFGAVLSFLGLRSTEVTTVLRNDPAQASLIALILLLGVLAAVLIVVIDNDDSKKIPWTSAAGVVVLLLGIGSFVIYAIPVSTSVGLLSLVLGCILVPLGIIIALISFPIWVGLVLMLLGATAFLMYAIPGSIIPVPAADRLLGLVLGSILVPLGIIILLIKVIRHRRVTVSAGIVLAVLGAAALVKYAIPRIAIPVPAADRLLSLVLGSILVPLGIIILLIGSASALEKIASARQKIQGWHERHHWLREPPTPLTVIFTLASVIFIAISAYGGMRLETGSQLSSSAQVAASIDESIAATTLSAHVTAYKIKDGSWVGITVFGLPTSIKTDCNELGQSVPPNQASCQQDPCGPGPYRLRYECTVVMNGTVAPDANGDVDDTLSIPLKTDAYQDIDVRAVICSPTSCQGVNGGTGGNNQIITTEGSRLDILMPTPSASASHR